MLEKIKNKIKMILLFLLNPRLLLCIGIGWMITNGWSYIMFGFGMYFEIEWMIAVSSTYLAFLWFPFSPEKIATVAIALALLKWIFPNDEKTLAVLSRMYHKAKNAVKRKKANKKGEATMQKNVFEKIDELNATYVDVWEDVCNIESPSADKARVDCVGEYFKKLAQDRNWEIEVYPQERFGDVICITMNPESKKRPIALSGHMDTVHPVGIFGTPAVRRDEKNLYGPGAMDCKGGVVAGFLAMDALHSCGYKDRPVMMLLQSNEEIGSGLDNKAPIQWICKKAESAEAFLNLEGHEGYFEGKACLIRKGIAGFRFEIEGVAAHASYCAREGANAIREAAYKIIEIENIKDDQGVTCNCGIITGGSATNTVAAQCQFRVDVRFATQQQYEDTKEQLQKIADTVHVPGCTCTMVQTNLRPAMELNEQNQALLEKANALFEKNGLSRLEIGMRTGGSDAADVTCCGIPCLDSIGVGGERAHSIEEYGVIDSLAESAKRIASIICGL